MWILVGLWLLLITGLTFAFWLRPTGLFRPRPDMGGESLSAVNAVLAVVFFISYFALGCWLSVLNVKGW